MAKEMRELGAVRVRVGEIEVDFGMQVALDPFADLRPTPETAEDLARKQAFLEQYLSSKA